MTTAPVAAGLSPPQPRRPEPEPTSAQSTRRANIALGVFLAAYILSFMDRQILSLMVEPIRRDLGISDLQIGLLQGLAFAALYSVVGIPIGLLADRLSRRLIISSGVLFWSACTALCGFAASYPMLFLARMGVGVGEAALSPAAHSSMSDAFPPARLSRAMAIYTLGITIGGGVALLVGGSVVDMIASRGEVILPGDVRLTAWRAAFLIVSLPGALVAGLVLLTREPKRRGHSMALPGGLRPVLHHLGANWRCFLSIYGNSTLLSIVGYGLMAWYPTLLIRRFDMSAGMAATWLGLAYLVFGSLGTLTGGAWAERLALRGRSEANMRVVTMLSLACILPAALAPIMPTPLLVILLFVPLTFFHNGYFACSTAAIQLTMPGTMRATGAALFLMANSLVGLSLGTAAVPLIGAAVGGDHGGLGGALSLIGGLGCTGAALVGWWGLRAYGALVTRTAGHAAT